MFGQILGAVAGGLLGRSGAKADRKAQQAQLDAQMEGYNFSKPYIQRSYDRAEGALNDVLDQGAYTQDRLMPTKTPTSPQETITWAAWVRWALKARLISTKQAKVLLSTTTISTTKRKAIESRLLKTTP